MRLGMVGLVLAGLSMAGAFGLVMNASDKAPDYSYLWKQGDRPPCFDVSQTHSQQDDPPTILVNRCTGETWALVKVPNYGVNGKTSGYKLEWVKVPKT